MNKLGIYISSIENNMKNFSKPCLVSIVARVALFFVFWSSVQTKISGWNVTLFDSSQNFAFWAVTENTFDLFTYEYDLPLIAPKIAAYLASFAEFFLSLAILFGLFTRFAALGLLVMTIVIQIFVYPDAYVVHLTWTAMLLFLVNYGGGHLSLDYLLRNK